MIFGALFFCSFVLLPLYIDTLPPLPDDPYAENCEKPAIDRDRDIYIYMATVMSAQARLQQLWKSKNFLVYEENSRRAARFFFVDTLDGRERFLTVTQKPLGGKLRKTGLDLRVTYSVTAMYVQAHLQRWHYL